YYQRKNSDAGGIRQFDVGLHALTNFIKKGEKGKPFSKLLKQLRLSWDDFKLHPQTHSVIHFPDVQLKFNNDFELLQSEVMEKFPHQKDQFVKLVNVVREFNELDLSLGYTSTREKLKTFITEPLLLEMILCPLLIYGSAWEEDMDFAQFVIMFKSLYFEGFSRPEGGVRRIIKLLVDKYTENGGELRFKAPVAKILTKDNKACGVRLESGEEIFADQVFSSMGLPETILKVDAGLFPNPSRTGQMTFLESIFVFDKKPQIATDATIFFYNNSNHYHYRPAQNFYDASSAVVCLPDNYEIQNKEGEGTVRVTYMANYTQWKNLERDQYVEKKNEVAQNAKDLLKKLMPTFDATLRFTDVFSPTTIERYTWHLNGTVYGSIDKSRDGRTPVKNLFIIGTDQGFLGIVGAMLSGISMANLHGLMQAEAG
ncbi:MAG: FAD-dependent oxidoreductase, partial [Bacteriovoracaceae bacterium]|nr:FAD-dependent oxidoreductase [Bacteriovoracaceae bacterium]